MKVFFFCMDGCFDSHTPTHSATPKSIPIWFIIWKFAATNISKAGEYIRQPKEEITVMEMCTLLEHAKCYLLPEGDRMKAFSQGRQSKTCSNKWICEHPVPNELLTVALLWVCTGWGDRQPPQMNGSGLSAGGMNGLMQNEQTLIFS